MRRALLAAAFALAAGGAQAQYVDGLPVASSVSGSDLVPLTQGSTKLTGGNYLPGSGTARAATVQQILNGTVTDVSGANLTATGSTTARTMAVRAAEVINVLDYGAKCDGSTNDSTAINAAISQVRTLITANVGAAVVLEFPPSISNGSGGLTFRRCVVNSPLNFTGIYSSVGNVLNVTVEGNGTEIYGNMAGSPVIDALGANQIVWRNVHIITGSSNVPTYGIQIGRLNTTGSDYGGGANMRFDDVSIVGYFSSAAFYNFAGEEVILTRPRFVNSYSSATAYAYVADGFNHFNITSSFATETAPVDTAQSFEETTVVGGSFQGDGALMVSPVWMGAVTQHRIINVYIYGTSVPDCVTLYNESAGSYLGIKGLDLDIHCEGGALTSKILINGTLAAPVIRDLTLREVYEFSTGTLFALGGSATSATLEHPRVNISGGPASPAFTVFDTPSAYSTVGGEFYLYAAGPWVPPGNLTSRVDVPGATQSNAAETCASPGAVATSTRGYQSNVFCVTTLRGTTTGSSAIRLTSDGQAAGSANCINLPQPYGSIAALYVNIVARDRTTTTNTTAWIGWTMTYGAANGAANTAVVAATKPTPVTTGTVTGTDISATADNTSNACLNLTWTPPTSNTDLWDVVASVQYTQVR